MHKSAKRPSSRERELLEQLRRKLHIKTLDEVHAEIIQRTLRLTRDDKALSADLVGMARTPFYRFLRRGCKPEKKRTPKPQMSITQLRRKLGLKTTADGEREAIQKALRCTRGDMALSAKLLGIGKTTIYRYPAKNAHKRS